MMTLAERDPHQQGFLTLWFIWVAMVASLLVYVFICSQFGEEIRRTQGSDLPINLLRNLFYVVAVITVFVAHFLRKLMLSARFSNSGGKGFETGAGSQQSALVARYTIATIVALALSESIGVFGFVLFLLGDSMQTLYIFVGISAVAMFFYRPKREEYERLANPMPSQGMGTPDI